MADENQPVTPAAPAPAPTPAASGLSKEDVTKLIGSHFSTFETNLLEKITKQFTPAPAPAPTPSSAPTPGGTTKQDAEQNTQTDAMKKLLEQQAERIKAMEDKNKQQEVALKDTSKKSAVESALSGYEFHNAAAKMDALNSILPSVVESADGGWVSADARTVEAIVAEVLQGAKSYLLKPENSGGSGASRGNMPFVPGGSKVSMEDIKPGMSKEQQQALAVQIRRVLPSRNN